MANTQDYANFNAILEMQLKECFTRLGLTFDSFNEDGELVLGTHEIIFRDGYSPFTRDCLNEFIVKEKSSEANLIIITLVNMF